MTSYMGHNEKTGEVGRGTYENRHSAFDERGVLLEDLTGQAEEVTFSVLF